MQKSTRTAWHVGKNYLKLWKCFPINDKRKRTHNKRKRTVYLKKYFTNNGNVIWREKDSLLLLRLSEKSVFLILILR